MAEPQRRWQPPAAVVERARQMAAGELDAAPARPAATVLLLRDGETGLEVLLQRRASTMAFAAGMHAFPGGRVDPTDAAPVPWHGGEHPEQVVAAVREVYEECGILLGSPLPEADVVADERRRLEGHHVGLGDLLTDRGALLDGSVLRPWARWITPEVEPRRYDTWFYVTALPSGQTPDETPGEADEVLWVRPGEAAGLPMMPPTTTALAELAEHATVADVLAAAAGRDLRAVLPRIVFDAEGVASLDVVRLEDGA